MVIESWGAANACIGYKLCCCFAGDATRPDTHKSMHKSKCQGLPDSAFPSRRGEEQRALHEGRGILQHILLMLYLNCEGLVGVTLQRRKKDTLGVKLEHSD